MDWILSSYGYGSYPGFVISNRFRYPYSYLNPSGKLQFDKFVYKDQAEAMQVYLRHIGRCLIYNADRFLYESPMDYDKITIEHRNINSANFAIDW